MLQDGSPLANRFLAALPENEYQRLEPYLTSVSLTMGTVLYDASEKADELPLTQEFMDNMLGCGRSGVTLAAGSLQRSGLIRYSRGKITIIDRPNLEDVACECYELFYHNFYRQ